jgi:hypothetical protein
MVMGLPASTFESAPTTPALTLNDDTAPNTLRGIGPGSARPHAPHAPHAHAHARVPRATTVPDSEPRHPQIVALATTVPAVEPVHALALATTTPAPDTERNPHHPSFPRTSTAPMPNRPSRPSPLARSLDMRSPMDQPREAAAAAMPDIVVFPGERISRLDDFVRLRLASEQPTFVAVLSREGLAPDYYAAMCARFANTRRRNPLLDAEYTRRLQVFGRRTGKLTPA